MAKTFELELFFKQVRWEELRRLTNLQRRPVRPRPGVNLTAAIGCVAVLQTGVVGVPRLFLLAAIGLFALALLVAAALMGLLPRLMERLPVEDEAGRLVSVYEGWLWRGLRLRTLVLVQFSLFVLALLSFGGWVLTKPAPG